mgnify:CR=1 FL=1
MSNFQEFLDRIQFKKDTNPDFKLIGYISSDTFYNRGRFHFTTIEGYIVCGSTSRFGYDAHTEIRFINYQHFETDQYQSFRLETAGIDLKTNHLPLDHFINCKKCQKLLKKFLENKIK